MSTIIDLSLLPPPDAVETIDYETILAARKARLIERFPDAAPTLELESEPLVALLEENAYLEMTLRQRVNDSVLAVLLATATGSMLDHLGTLTDTQRLAGESDATLRARIQQAPYAFSSAGPVGAYLKHARQAHADVLDAAVSSPTPGEVLVTILSRAADGAASPSLLATVLAALSGETVRPLNDRVSVVGATVTTYQVIAAIEIGAGPETAVVAAAANAAVWAHVKQAYRLGMKVTRSGLIAALRQPGVTRVELIAPAADTGTDILLDPGPLGATLCTAVTIEASNG
jgi:phage-related baseplate assembly protein